MTYCGRANMASTLKHCKTRAKPDVKSLHAAHGHACHSQYEPAGMPCSAASFAIAARTWGVGGGIMPSGHQRRWHFASGMRNVLARLSPLSLSVHGPTQPSATCSATRSPHRTARIFLRSAFRSSAFGCEKCSVGRSKCLPHVHPVWVGWEWRPSFLGRFSANLTRLHVFFVTISVS